MHKKFLYTFIILAMLFGAFGMMGQGGVTPVLAAQGFNPGAVSPFSAHGAVNYTPLPHYERIPNGNFSPSMGNVLHLACGGRFVDIDALGQTSWAGFTGVPSVSYFRIRVNPLAADRMIVGVFAQDPQFPVSQTFNELGCAANVAAGAPIDLVVTIPANTPVYVVVGRLRNPVTPAVYPPIAGDVDIYIQRTMDPSGGLIIQTDSAIPHPRMTWLAPLLNVDAQVYNKATGLAQRTIIDANGIAWFDVPAGIYNVGFWDQIVPFAARYSDLVAGGWYARTPLFDTFVSATGVRVRSAQPSGMPITLQYRFRPDDADFAWDFDLGARGILVPDDTIIFVTPGPWTINGYLEQAGAPDYNLFQSKMVDSFFYTMVDFRLHIVGGVNAARVLMCAPVARENGVIHMQVGAFEPSVFSFFNGGLTSPVPCPRTPSGMDTQGGWMYLTTGIDYNAYAEVHEIHTNGQLDQYFLNPVPYPFPITTAGVNTTQWSTVFANIYADRNTFASTVGIVGGPEFVMPVTADIVHTRATWNDASGNQLFRMVIGGVDRFPTYTLTRGLGGVLLNLAQDWELTTFDAIPPIGRYSFEGMLPTGGNNVSARLARVLYAVSPTDTRMLGHWAWSWVMALYETDYTTGIDANNFGPDQEMSRAEMAVFLSRVMSDISTIAAAPAATGTVFTDVAQDYWAARWIEHLYDLGITAGFADGTFKPDQGLNRAEMAKFIQLSFRAAEMAGWNPPPVDPLGLPLWDTNWNVITPGVIFVDVPANYWANVWIDEMWVDGLTDGCRTELSGAAFIHYYCPEDPVTRGQMAKFINSALRPNQDQPIVGTPGTQWLWPVLSPER